jgi:hypothetical protein
MPRAEIEGVSIFFLVWGAWPQQPVRHAIPCGYWMALLQLAKYSNVLSPGVALPWGVQLWKQLQPSAVRRDSQ